MDNPQIGLFETPKLDGAEQDVIVRIEQIRSNVKYMLSSAKRWSGVLARVTLAKSIRGSNSIEGYLVSVEDAIAAVDGDEPLSDPTALDWLAVSNYRRAMTYILQLAEDPHFRYDENLLRGLHYQMLAYDLDKNPGRWRPGSIHVQRSATKEIIYTAPDPELVPPLMKKLVDWLSVDDSPAIVKAAMAHLNLAMIHPFSDGNGRMARALQTLVLVRGEHIMDKRFSSIEEHLGKVREIYYEKLEQVGGRRWSPSGDARPFVRFCLTAHLHQAEFLRQYSRYMAHIVAEVEAEARQRGLNERLQYAMVDAVIGLRVRNALYRRTVEIKEHLASRDLKELVDEGLLIPEGERRGRIYKAGELLTAIRLRAREAFPPLAVEDPFTRQIELFGGDNA